MTFKDMIKDDLNIFINSNEFAEIHLINNIQTRCLIDNDRLADVSANEQIGIYFYSKLIYVKKSDYKGSYNINSQIIVDRNIYSIDDIKDNDGMLEIIISQNRG